MTALRRVSSGVRQSSGSRPATGPYRTFRRTGWTSNGRPTVTVFGQPTASIANNGRTFKTHLYSIFSARLLVGRSNRLAWQPCGERRLNEESLHWPAKVRPLGASIGNVFSNRRGSSPWADTLACCSVQVSPTFTHSRRPGRSSRIGNLAPVGLSFSGCGLVAVKTYPGITASGGRDGAMAVRARRLILKITVKLTNRTADGHDKSKLSNPNDYQARTKAQVG